MKRKPGKNQSLTTGSWNLLEPTYTYNIFLLLICINLLIWNRWSLQKLTQIFRFLSNLVIEMVNSQIMYISLVSWHYRLLFWSSTRSPQELQLLLSLLSWSLRANGLTACISIVPIKWKKWAKPLMIKRANLKSQNVQVLITLML